MLLGARQFFASKPAPALPYDAEVEYLESTGTQWIDTGIRNKTVAGAFSFTMSIRFTSVVATSYKGSGYSPPSPNQFFYAQNASTNIGLYMGFNGIVNLARRLSSQKTSWHTVQAVSDGSTVDYLFDNTNVGHFGFARLSIAGMFLFAICDGADAPNSTTIGLQQISGASLSVGGCSVFNFVPVRCTNELGQSEGAMYDRVSGALFRNAGTGAFLYGNDKS